MPSSISVGASYLSLLPSNINLLYFKKNTKVAKFVLLSELLYTIIQQSRNYNKLYLNLILQLKLIKKKLFEKIKEELLITNGYHLQKNLKARLTNLGIEFNEFLSKLVSMNEEKFKNYFLNKLIENNSLNLDKQSLRTIKSIRKTVENNVLLIKYKYLKQINLHIKYFTINKFKIINNLFYPIIYNVLKKETNRSKLRILMRKIITKYLFKGLNIELSRNKLQTELLKVFKISNRYNIRVIPSIEEIHLKERKPIRSKKDIASSIDRIVTEITSQFGFGYFKLLKMLKKNKLDSIPLGKFVYFLNNLESHTLYGFFKSKGLNLSLIKDDFFFDLNNRKISIFNAYENNNLYLFEKNSTIIEKKHFLQIYNFYNFFNSISKRRKKNYFLSSMEKQIEYFATSPIKYYYFDQFFLQVDRNEIVSNELNYYVSIKNIIFYIKKYGIIFKSNKNVLSYFKNFERNERNIKKIRRYGQNEKINLNTVILFFRKLKSAMTNKLKEIENKLKKQKFDHKLYLQKDEIRAKKEIKVIKGILSFLSTINYISLSFLQKKKKYLFHRFKSLFIDYVDNYFYQVDAMNFFGNSNVNRLSIKDIYKNNNLFNFSEELNKFYLYSKYNHLFKKYFSKIRKSIIKNKESIKNNMFITSTSEIKKKSFLNYKYNKIFRSFEKKTNLQLSSFKLEKYGNKDEKIKLKMNMLFNKLFKIDISEIEMEDISKYILNNNIKFNSIYYNNTLYDNIYNIFNYKEKYINNKEVVYNKQKLNLFNEQKSLILSIFKNNISILNNNNSQGIKKLNIENNLNNFLYKKIGFYKNILLLSKYDKNIIFYKNIFFTFNEKNENEYKKLNLIDLLKISNSFSEEDFNKVLSKTIDYTTTELKKVTKNQMKKRKLKRIY